MPRTKKKNLFKIIGIGWNESSKSNKMGKLVEKGKASFLYYGDEKRHYKVFEGYEKTLK